MKSNTIPAPARAPAPAAAAAAANLRRVYHPIQKDYVTFLETAALSGGRRTFVEVELARGGGNGMHVHTSFAERFVALEGALGVQLGRERRVLRAGESVTAHAGVPHRFYNAGRDTARFHVEITPGHAGFEAGLRITYGLAADGLVSSMGIPKSIAHLAVIVDLSDSATVGAMAVLMPVFRWLARRARAQGIERELLRRYVDA